MTPIPATLSDVVRDPRGLGGLLALVDGREVAFPLAAVRVRAAIAGDCARTVIEQRFENHLTTVVEAVHIFPLPDEGAVIEVELRSGDHVVRAECRERKDAERVFDEARRAGHVAGLLTSERADVHTLRVTNLAPGHAITVRITVVERLETVDGQTRWRFPTTIAPRYTPGQVVDHRGPGAIADTDRVPDASRLSPPIRMEGGTPLDLEVEVAGPVRAIASSLHAVRLDLDDGAVRVAPSGDASCDRDFVLAFRTREEAMAARAWTDGAHTLVRVEPPVFARVVLPRDAVFVVDISGSMGGTKLIAAKRALTSALHGLSPGDRFALIAFDDRVERFRTELIAYDDASLAAADAWIAALGARAGTEMLPAIAAALAGDTPAGRLRTVLFVTDGQATNDAELIAAVANRRGSARFFALGIDTAVNAALMRALARAGGGTAELCTPEDDIEGVVARIEARFGSPLVDDVRVEGGISARPEPAALFSGRAVSVLLEGAPNEVVVTGRGAEGPVRLVAVARRVAFPLGALWARERVAYLEDRLALRPFEEEAIRPEVLRVALAHQIASKYTAFVAVDRGTVVVGERVEVVQPVQAPHGWAPGLGASGGSGPIGRPPMPAPAPPPSLSSAPRAPSAERMRAAAFPSVAEPAPIAAGGAARDVAGELARAQAADGSFGGDVGRTAAALVALVLLGNSRLAGTRQRTVAKAANWLAGRHEAEAIAALAFLDACEGGAAPVVGDLLRGLRTAGAEGAVLGELL